MNGQRIDQMSSQTRFVDFDVLSGPIEMESSASKLNEASEDGPVLCVNPHRTQPLHNPHSRAHPPKDRVLVIQVRCGA